MIYEYDCVLNSPHIPAWTAGRNAARASTQRHAVISGPSWPLRNRRGSSQLPVTVSKGSLDTSLVGKPVKPFFAKLVHTARPSTTHRSVTAPHTHRGSPLPSGRWCVQHTSGTACGVKGALWFCQVKQRQLYPTVRKQTQMPNPQASVLDSFLHNTSRKSQNYPHPASKSVDSKPDVQLCKNILPTLK